MPTAVRIPLLVSTRTMYGYPMCGYLWVAGALYAGGPGCWAVQRPALERKQNVEGCHPQPPHYRRPSFAGSFYQYVAILRQSK